MSSFASIFTDINLPNPTTWFYFSGLLAVALFFKFGRVLSLIPALRDNDRNRFANMPCLVMRQ